MQHAGWWWAVFNTLVLVMIGALIVFLLLGIVESALTICRITQLRREERRRRTKEVEGGLDTRRSKLEASIQSEAEFTMMHGEKESRMKKSPAATTIVQPQPFRAGADGKRRSTYVNSSKFSATLVAAAAASTMYLLLASQAASAFQLLLPPPPQCSPKRTSNTRTAGSRLFLARKVKRGKLASSVDLLDDSTASATVRTTAAPKKQRSRQGKNKKGSTAAAVATKKNASAVKGVNKQGEISPALAAWMEKQGHGGEDDAAVVAADEDVEEDAASTFTSFQDRDSKSETSSQKKSKKRSPRKALEEERSSKVQQLVKEFQGALESSEKDVFSAVEPSLRSLLRLQSTNFRQITNAARSTDYRLAWVGSDDALCSICTGLHKVPLARMQEVFLTVGNRGRVQMQEVIRILGPFPNVKNTLDGTGIIKRLDGGSGGNSDDDIDTVNWQVTWTSMIDGTGKELLANKEENTRVVDLHVCFCDPTILLAVVAPADKAVGGDRSSSSSSSRRQDPLESKGQHVLVFVQDDGMEEKLEKLRVV